MAAGGVADRFRSKEGFPGKLRQIEASCTSTYRLTVGYFKKMRVAVVVECEGLLQCFTFSTYRFHFNTVSYE